MLHRGRSTDVASVQFVRQSGVRSHDAAIDSSVVSGKRADCCCYYINFVVVVIVVSAVTLS